MYRKKTALRLPIRFHIKGYLQYCFHTQQVVFFGRACPGLWLLPCLVSNNNMPKNYLFCRFLTVLFVLSLNRKQAGSTRSHCRLHYVQHGGTSCTQCALWTHEKLTVFCISATKKGIRIPIYPPAEPTPVVQKAHSVRDEISSCVRGLLRALLLVLSWEWLIVTVNFSPAFMYQLLNLSVWQTNCPG